MEYIVVSDRKTIIERLERVAQFIDQRLYDRLDMEDALSAFELRLGDFEALKEDQRYDGIDSPLFLYRKAIDKHKYQGALHHLRAIQKIVKPRANDVPFKVDDRVRIIRTEHGWDCFPKCVVVEATQNIRGIWQYKVVPEDEKDTWIKEGSFYEIAHTRDLIREYF